MMDLDKEFRMEQNWLTEVLERLRSYSSEIGKQLIATQEHINEALKMYNPDDLDNFTEAMYQSQLLSSLKVKAKVSKSSLLKPYFARVDFKEDGTRNNVPYYIGKMSIFGEKDAQMVIDWRAPVSSLYYDGRIGEAAYDCPDGTITGEISLKRQYYIENAELTSFIDVDITANDEFLQAALGSSKDKRLKDIVSTIQAEQNQIIRADMHGPVIVQGAAGSGKTTIALHRIAYLLYTFERLSPEHVMVIAPNRYFLSYISDVLPDLGVENVYQTTFEDFVFKFIEESAPLSPPDEKLGYIINNPEKKGEITSASVYKSSLAYKDEVEKYVNSIIMKLIPEKDFSLGEYRLLSYEYIQNLFVNEYAFLPVEKRINEVRKYLSSALKKRKPEFIKVINDRSDQLEARIKRKTKENSDERREALTKLYNTRDAKINEINRNATGLIPNYFKDIKLKSAIIYYNEFLGVKGKTKLESEDLAPLLLIYLAFYGNTGFDIRHIVVDEAQDMGLFRTYVLRKLLGTGSFTILGDICQGIYSFMGINDWDSVADIFENKGVRYMQLEQSYRTTVEIMDFANKAMKHLNLKNIPLAKPVIRHGNKVTVNISNSHSEAAKNIDALINNYKNDNYQSIAIICKTSDECTTLKQKLKTKARVLTGKESDYGGGIVILPAYLSKGLEFDCVIIANANKDTYRVNELEIKLLYVAMTRALHEMSVFAVGGLTEVLV